MRRPEGVCPPGRRRAVRLGRRDVRRSTQRPGAFRAIRGRPQAQRAERTHEHGVVSGVEVRPAGSHGPRRPFRLAFVERQFRGNERHECADIGVDLAHVEAFGRGQERVRHVRLAAGAEQTRRGRVAIDRPEATSMSGDACPRIGLRLVPAAGSVHRVDGDGMEVGAESTLQAVHPGRLDPGGRGRFGVVEAVGDDELVGEVRAGEDLDVDEAVLLTDPARGLELGDPRVGLAE